MPAEYNVNGLVTVLHYIVENDGAKIYESFPSSVPSDKKST